MVRARPRFKTHVHPVAASVAQPAGRLLLLVGYFDKDDDEPFVEVHAVVGLRTVVEHRYERIADDDTAPTSADSKELEAHGWSHTDAAVRTEPLVVVDDLGIVSDTDMREAFGAMATRLILADWPPADDAERLEPHVTSVKVSVAQLVARHRSRSVASAGT